MAGSSTTAASGRSPAARSASAPPLTETPGFPFQLTIADVDTLAIRDRIRLDTAFRPWQFSAGRAASSTRSCRTSTPSSLRHGDAGRWIRRLDLPVKPGVTVADWDFEAPHHGLALTDDGRTLCLAGRASDYAALVDARDLTLIATIPVGDGPGWAEVTHDGRFCLVTNTRAHDLSIISIASRSEVARLPMGKGPKHITMARLPADVVVAVKARR